MPTMEEQIIGRKHAKESSWNCQNHNKKYKNSLQESDSFSASRLFMLMAVKATKTPLPVHYFILK